MSDTQNNSNNNKDNNSSIKPTSLITVLPDTFVINDGCVKYEVLECIENIYSRSGNFTTDGIKAVVETCGRVP